MFITPRVVENENDLKNTIEDLRRRMQQIDDTFDVFRRAKAPDPYGDAPSSPPPRTASVPPQLHRRPRRLHRGPDATGIRAPSNKASPFPDAFRIENMGKASPSPDISLLLGCNRQFGAFAHGRHALTQHASFR